ncbi:MAG: hypothetical protein ACI9G1_001621 [Pirellulaceae bacterium]|jgi:hypothetical protein
MNTKIKQGAGRWTGALFFVQLGKVQLGIVQRSAARLEQGNELTTIKVEFFGVPRQRAGVAQIEIPCESSVSLAFVLLELESQLPELAAECFRDGRLSDGYIASLDGRQFVVDAALQVHPGQSLLIMSSDAGG